MPQPKTPAALPPVTVGRFKHVTLLIERLAAEKTSIFLSAMAGYRDQQRAATARPLTPTEATSIAAHLANELGEENPVTLAEQVQQSDLRASDPPDPRELLLAAGTATAPAFVDAALRVCALIEMPASQFEQAVETGTLTGELDTAAAALERMPMTDARSRAARALEHFVTQTTGGSPGEAWGLLTGTVWQALSEAINRLAASSTPLSTDLLDPTAGRAGTSSTA